MRSKNLLIPLIILFLLYSVFLVTSSLSGFPEDMHDGQTSPYLAEKPIGEDAYYMLTVSWNMASGRGIVYNYDTPVTGVQPLSTIIYALIAKFVLLLGGDKWLFLRAIILITSIFLLFFGHIVGLISSNISSPNLRGDAYALGFLGIVFNFSMFRLFTYGLETGIYLVLFALCILYSLNILQAKESNLKEMFLFGILGGLTMWARIDFGVVFFIFLFISVAQRNLKVFDAFIAGAISILTISPWFVYVFSVSGEWMPSSGSVQSGLITVQNMRGRIFRLGIAILDHLTPWFHFEVNHIVLRWIAFISFLVFLIVIVHKGSVFNLLKTNLRNNTIFLNWFCSITILTAIYLLFFRSRHFYTRYSAPLIIPIIIIMAIVIAERVNKSKIFKMTLISVLVMFFGGWAYLSLHTGRIGISFPVTAGFIQTELPTVKVGAFQSGVVGFFNPNVVNLDGKVNQQAWFYREKGIIHQYIDAEQINILIGWPGVIYREIKAPDWLETNWEQCFVPVPDDIQNTMCLRRKTISEK